MLKTKLTCAAVAAAACLALPSFAQDRDWDHHDRGHDNNYSRNYDSHDRDSHDRDARHMGNRGEEGHHWNRGDRLPEQYRRHEYVVNDWHARHLHAPPRGYQWVNVDGNLVLVAVATGIIADLALNSR